MKVVNVSVDTEYEVVIGKGIISEIGQRVKELVDCDTVMIISDDNVYALYGKQVEQNFKEAGIASFSFCIKPGEQSKCAENYISILRAAVKSGLSRRDAIIALGGGVVGDLAGFVAATYQRGVALIQVPTSLLAMVDSSVGGKTAIDIPEGKNLVGAFYQPNLVLCDVELLNTLPQPFWTDGYAEVLKYAILFDRKLWMRLMEKEDVDVEKIIEKCVTYKRDIVEDDEKETGNRALLNFGHTIGHAVELSTNFSWSHGRAVALGMAYISYIAYREYGFPYEELLELLIGFKRYGFDLNLPCSAENIANAIMFDKKRSGSIITLVLPRSLGECYFKKVKVSEFSQKLLDYQLDYKKNTGFFG